MFAETGKAFAGARRARRLAVAARAAHPVVPDGRAAAGGGRPHLRDCRQRTPGVSRSRRADRARRAPRRARRAGRGLADREARAGRGAPSPGRRSRRRAPRRRRCGWRRASPTRSAAGSKSGEKLASEDRPIRAGDILILVRKRAPFAAAMISALKLRGIKVAGADRLVLTEQIAVQDLIALGDFLMLPEDDLALAAVLKSPLIGLDDDDLLALAPKRQGSLWQELIARAGHKRASGARPPRASKRWRARAAQSAAVRVLRGAARRRGHARAHAGAARAPRRPTPSTSSSTWRSPTTTARRHRCRASSRWLRDGTREIKRDMEQGLRRGARDDRARRQGPGGADRVPARHLLDPVGAAARQPAALDERGAAVERAARRSCGRSRARAISASCSRPRRRWRRPRREERNRLLYVALTRARDRLYVAGFEGRNPPPPDCWYNLIRDGLGRLACTR